MYPRNITKYLKKWKTKKERKPLVIRGARQVGKTSTVLDFGKKEFKNVAYINLDNPEHNRHFRNPLSLKEFIQTVSLNLNATIKKGDTLLFIDEIQNSRHLVKLLRFFYEEMPELHVIAAGSLLEAFIQKQGFEIPVGRVEYAYMYPMDFYEFLKALGKDKLVDYLEGVTIKQKIPDAIHTNLTQLFEQYVLIGGMPEAVKFFVKGQYEELRTVYNSILTTYTEDISKYANQAKVNYLSFVIDNAPLHAGKAITFNRFADSEYRSREMSAAFRLLSKVMLMYLVKGTLSTELPLIGKPKRPQKLIFLDTGLVSYRMNLPQTNFHLSNTSNLYRGSIAEQITGQMILNQHTHETPYLYYWTRKKSATEVDFCMLDNGRIVGIEVKSGNSGKMKSLFSFASRVAGSILVKIHKGEFELQSVEHSGNKYKILNLPFYLVPRLRELVREAYTHPNKYNRVPACVPSTSAGR